MLGRMDTLNTVSEVLAKLKEEGYTAAFYLADDCLLCRGQALEIYPEAFVVDKYFRLEGASGPDKEAVVFAISSARHQVKGTLVYGSGVHGDSASALGQALRVAAHESGAADQIAEKGNDATPQRPAGERTLDAALLALDLAAARQQIKQEPAWTTSDRNAITLFKTNGLRLVLIALRQGAKMKTYTTNGHLTALVLEGTIRFDTAEQSVALGEGQLLALHAGLPHRVEALAESTFLLTLTTTLAGKEAHDSL
jgi:quercetin dioxygenase-like cupin family protein